MRKRWIALLALSVLRGVTESMEYDRDDREALPNRLRLAIRSA